MYRSFFCIHFSRGYSGFIWQVLPPVMGVSPNPEMVLLSPVYEHFPKNIEKGLKIFQTIKRRINYKGRDSFKNLR